MVLRSISGDRLGLTPEVTRPLGALLNRGRHAAVRRAALPAAGPCWDAAEARTTVAAARADAVAGTSADARVLVATMVASVGHELSDCQSGSLLGRHPATAAFDTASVASWLRRIGQELDKSGDNLYDEARVLAEALLASPATTDELLAEAWITVCGLALLEEIAAAPEAPDAEARLIQRAVATTLVSHRVAPEARIARLTGVDRQTLAQWLRFGPPSPECSGHHISAAFCGALTGMTGPQWRRLHSIGHVPEARDSRGTLNWDESEVLRWAETHSGDDCGHRCYGHHRSVAKVAAAGGAGGPFAATGRTGARPRLALVR